MMVSNINKLGGGGGGVRERVSVRGIGREIERENKEINTGTRETE